MADLTKGFVVRVDVATAADAGALMRDAIAAGHTGARVRVLEDGKERPIKPDELAEVLEHVATAD